MFNLKSNNTCNNALFSGSRIQRMEDPVHEQMRRLYLAAKELKGVEGQSDVAYLLNESPQTVNNWETRGISDKGKIKAQYKIGCSAVWLETGKGPMCLGVAQKPADYDIDDNSDFSAIRRVKFKISAGISGYSIEYLNGDRAPIFFRNDWLSQRGYSADNLVAVTVSGASMEPSLFDGDLVVINIADTKPEDGRPFAANYEGEVVVKRLKRDAGEWWLSSDNQDKRRYPDKRCTDDVYLIGKIIHKQSENV